jgi:DNA invertase Pin-like site-specific DNA recombinase
MVISREKLKGRRAISYSRWSSLGQGVTSSRLEGGDSEGRQQAVLDDIAREFDLVVDQALIDAAVSGSKGHNRIRGQLRDFLELVESKRIPPGTVFIVESMSRLSRELPTTVLQMLIEIVMKGKLILITGSKAIWDSSSINSSANHALLAEINAAYEYAQTLSYNVKSAHRRTRARLQKFSEGEAPAPMTSGFPPAWVRRTGTTSGAEFTLIESYAEIVREIFDMCINGYSAFQIANVLNKRKLKTFAYGGARGGAEWRASKISLLLRSEAVIGYYQPHIKVEGKRKPVGDKVKLYPAAIDPATWIAAREVLASRSLGLRGPQGEAVPNLFTGHAFCESCGRTLRCETASTRSGNGWKRLICSGNHDSGICPNHTRFDLRWFESIVVHYLSTLIAPKTTTSVDQAALLSKRAEIKVEIDLLQASLAALAPRIGSSVTLLDQFEAMGRKMDDMRRQMADVDMRLAAAEQPNTQVNDIIRFLKELSGPAKKGDLDARRRLRSLLNRLDYRLEGHGVDMKLTVSGRSHIIPVGHPDDEIYFAMKVGEGQTVVPEFNVFRRIDQA